MPIQELLFGKYLQQQRKELGLTPIQVAIKLGYRNTNKGIRRIAAIERGEIINDIIGPLMTLLNVTEDKRLWCGKNEESYINMIVSKMPKFKPVINYRAMACVYIQIEIPDHIKGRKNMIAFAVDFAKEHHAHCCLKLDYNLRFYINQIGEILTADKGLEEIPTSKPDIGKLL